MPQTKKKKPTNTKMKNKNLSNHKAMVIPTDEPFVLLLARLAKRLMCRFPGFLLTFPRTIFRNFTTSAKLRFAGNTTRIAGRW